MKNKSRVMIITLCLGVVFSSLGQMPLALASATVSKINSKIFGRPTEDNSITHEDKKPSLPEEEVLFTKTYPEKVHNKTDTTSTTKAVNQNVIESTNTIGLDTSNPQATVQPDKYNFTRVEIEKLMNEGFTLDDLHKADTLGNEFDVEPTKLLQHKKTDGKWDKIENELQRTKYGPIVEQLKIKHPDAKRALEKENIPISDQLVLLELIHQSTIPSAEEAIQRYKEKGKDALTQYIKEDKFYGSVSKPLMEKYDLTPEDVQTYRLTDEVLERAEQTLQSQGTSFKERFQKIKEESSK